MGYRSCVDILRSRFLALHCYKQTCQQIVQLNEVQGSSAGMFESSKTREEVMTTIPTAAGDEASAIL